MAIRGVQTAKPNSKEMKAGAKYLRFALAKAEEITDDERIAIQQCFLWFEQESAKYSK